MQKITVKDNIVKFYMIRHAKTGLYSNGDPSYPVWGDKGRPFQQRNHATNHIKRFYDRGFYNEAELVEFENKLVEVVATSIQELREESRQRAEARRRRADERWSKFKYEQAKRQVEEYEKSNSGQ